MRKFRHGLHVSGLFPPGIKILTCNTAAKVSTTLHVQCRLMHNHAPSKNLPVPSEGNIVWQCESLSKEEEEDELELEEDMPLTQSLCLGDKHGGEQTDSSKEERNSGAVPLQQQQQQDAEGDDAGGNGNSNGNSDGDDNGPHVNNDPHTELPPPRVWYYLAPQDIYCDAEATEQAVNQAGSGFVKVKILMKLAQLKSNDGTTLWCTMPNGDMYRDPLRAEAAVFEAGSKNLKVTHGLGDAGMVYLHKDLCVGKEKKKTWLPNSATTANVQIRIFSPNRSGTVKDKK
ncbi:hypothetical protein B0H17DRAFT_1147110 [Mycena rosella]|uniref:Uncharacterized protein n=1 Tax=Mycena rosella TaxID=1033263 RepID=A0AAD7G3T0_MYCRO|nr:hypothetical protein B0H17DRAFT_1147110 [Mycena rosella]